MPVQGTWESRNDVSSCNSGSCNYLIHMVCYAVKYVASRNNSFVEQWKLETKIKQSNKKSTE